MSDTGLESGVGTMPTDRTAECEICGELIWFVGTLPIYGDVWSHYGGSEDNMECWAKPKKGTDSGEIIER